MSHFREAAQQAGDLISMCYDGLEGWEDLATYIEYWLTRADR